MPGRELVMTMNFFDEIVGRENDRVCLIIKSMIDSELEWARRYRRSDCLNLISHHLEHATSLTRALYAVESEKGKYSGFEFSHNIVQDVAYKFEQEIKIEESHEKTN